MLIDSTHVKLMNMPFQVQFVHVVCMQVGPELELPGYGCEDHFQELDTVEHCWECIAGVKLSPLKLHAILCM